MEQIVHFAQLISQVPSLYQFCEFDYLKRNMLKYHSVSPPNYDLNKITTQVQLYYGDNDTQVAVGDAKKLAFQLPDANLRLCPGFAHLDFIASCKTAFLYNSIIEVMKNRSAVH